MSTGAGSPLLPLSTDFDGESMPFSREEFLQLRARVAAIDPLLVAASEEVDRTLLEWARKLSPLERLSAASRASEALHRFQVKRPAQTG